MAWSHVCWIHSVIAPVGEEKVMKTAALESAARVKLINYLPVCVCESEINLHVHNPFSSQQQYGAEVRLSLFVCLRVKEGKEWICLKAPNFPWFFCFLFFFFPENSDVQVCFYIDENRPRESRHCDSSSLLPPTLLSFFGNMPPKGKTWCKDGCRNECVKLITFFLSL